MQLARYKTEMLVGGSVLTAAAGQLLIKLGLMKDGRFTVPALHWPWTLSWGVTLGLAIYAIGTLLWFAAVAQKNISYLYPLAATNYVLLGLAGHFLLHEAMGLLRWTGILVMTIGVAALSRSQGSVIE